ncbi:MAG TPA: hypothetical protein VGU73_04685, partial [Acidimicrobiia bacterium]|nr:hypothetical protein [Acidimicrobiia bacterium]
APPPPAPAPEPAPTAPAPPATPPRDLDLDDVILAWAELLPGFSPATRAAVQAAQPLRVEGDVVVFGVAPELVEAARPRFKREADTIRAALAERFGRSVKFNLVPAADFVADGPAAAPRAPAPEPPPEELDADEVLDATDAPPEAPEARLTEAFGATVVDELPRP